ncbi:hypothetical protein L7F22_023113, partial [Adiantum nelumboides]|nr:hypothetical protein [Adiantum nelumboides]
MLAIRAAERERVRNADANSESSDSSNPRLNAGEAMASKKGVGPEEEGVNDEKAGPARIRNFPARWDYNCRLLMQLALAKNYEAEMVDKFPVESIASISSRKLLDDFQSSITSSSDAFKARIFTEKCSIWDIVVPHNGTTTPNNKSLHSSELDAPINEGFEQGQLDSLLLWPVGLAVEAISFQ